MSKYYDYGDFMVAVLKDADCKCLNIGSTLYKAFHLSAPNILAIVISILEVSWVAFVAVCGLLILGPVAFAVALAAFIAGGVGAIVVAALAIYGGIKSIKLLYQNRATPLTILEIGKKYKVPFDEHKGDTAFIDSLIDQASDEMLEMV